MASSQSENKHSIVLSQNDFSLHIIGMCGDAGHGKGAVDRLLSFG